MGNTGQQLESWMNFGSVVETFEWLSSIGKHFTFYSLVPFSRASEVQEVSSLDSRVFQATPPSQRNGLGV